MKEIEPIDGEQGVGDRINMAFSGTEVTKGLFFLPSTGLGSNG